MAFLSLTNISKSYYLEAREFPVLKGLNLNFELGEFVSILGESGGGKSTLMNIIGGLDREFQGSVTVEGKLLDLRDEKNMNEYRRQTVGYIYQSYNLISHLSVLDNVLVALDMTTLNRSEREARAKELLDRMGLSEHMRKRPNQLSGGQKQRVAIARALARDPKIIIADEPTGALDSQNTQEVLDILSSIAAEGRLVIAVTHSQTVANRGTRIVHLADGRIESQEQIRNAAQHGNENTTNTVISRPLRISRSIAMAAKHTRARAGLNSLIILGTAIGLFAVILFEGLGNGLSGYIADQIAKVANPQVISVSRYVNSDSTAAENKNPAPSQTSMPGASTGSATPDAARFSDAQIGQIRGVGHVQSVENAYTFASATAEVGGKKAIIPSLSNWTDGYTSSSLAAGRSPKPGEVVLDKSVITSKIESANTWRRIIGKKITLSFITTDTNGSQATVTLQATVSGVTESSNEAMQITAVNTRTLIDALARQHVETSPSSLVVKADGLDKVTSIGTTINGFKQEGKRLYSSTSVASLIDTVQTYLSLATTILSAIAAISLVVSALMIIVTMYMSVSARTKEIGVLRALGESKGNIRMLFTAESFIIGVISALLAAALALGIGELANHLLARIANYSFIQITGVNVLTIFAISVMIALVASILPARHAASLNPIDALGRD